MPTPAATRDADVIVVGAGPAGAVAALTLARRGVDVVLLDRKRFPRDKPCGGGVRYGVLRRFPEIAAYVRTRVALHEVRKVWMESPGGASVVAALDTPLYLTFRRLEFDTALVDLARARGVRVVEDVRITGLTRNGEVARLEGYDGRTLTARVVIGADGVNSVIARASGLTTGFPDSALALDTMEETPLAELSMADPDTMYVAYGYKGRPGYGYVFPKADCVDAGIGYVLSYFKQSLGESPYAHHRRFLEEVAARGIVTGTSHQENFKAYRLPLGGPLPRTCADRVVLCGDAGGFVNAYTGEGIYYAMVTGEHAGEAVADGLAAGDVSAPALDRYEARWRREIGGELADSLRIQRRIFTNPALVDAIIRAASVDRRLSRLFARVALGEEDLRRRKLELTVRFLAAALRARVNLWTVFGRRS
jgi:geranylgeranyl reductase family protein